MSIFGDYSQYYDLLYADKDYVSEVEYVYQLLNRFNGGERLLELGCGTGIHASLFAQKGCFVEGVDMSREMLNQADQLLNNSEPEVAEKLCFSEGDVRSYRSVRVFNSVVSLFHVINYQTENKDVQRMLKTANCHLSKGGLFLFDLWYSPAVLNLRPEVKIKKYENEQFFINRISNPEHRPNENMVVVNYELHIHNKQKDEWDYLKESHYIRYFSSPEIQFFAEQAGFRILHSEEWLSGNEPSENTWGVTFVLQKI